MIQLSQQFIIFSMLMICQQSQIGITCGPRFRVRVSGVARGVTLQILTHTCATSSPDVVSGSQHPNHAQIDLPISNSEDSVMSPHSPRTTVMSFISVLCHLVSVFARFSWGLYQFFQSSLEAIFRYSQIQLSIELIFLLYKLVVFKYLGYII